HRPLGVETAIRAEHEDHDCRRPVASPESPRGWAALSRNNQPRPNDANSTATRVAGGDGGTSKKPHRHSEEAPRCAGILHFTPHFPTKVDRLFPRIKEKQLPFLISLSFETNKTRKANTKTKGNSVRPSLALKVQCPADQRLLHDRRLRGKASELSSLFPASSTTHRVLAVAAAGRKKSGERQHADAEAGSSDWKMMRGTSWDRRRATRHMPATQTERQAATAASAVGQRVRPRSTVGNYTVAGRAA
ncbi:unnamed protein product, partial [Ixodes pacificus]